MLLSKRTQYGLRAMICFADAYERGFLQAGENSPREKLPPKFLESILNALARANFLDSKIGSAGGYRLARPPRTSCSATSSPASKAAASCRSSATPPQPASAPAKAPSASFNHTSPRPSARF